MTKLEQWFAERETLLAEVIDGLVPLIEKCWAFQREQERVLYSNNPEDQYKAQELCDMDRLIMHNQSMYSISEGLKVACKATLDMQANLISKHKTLTTALEAETA